MNLAVRLEVTRPMVETSPELLTDPFLQLPTKDSVRVVWFTEFAGMCHRVAYGTSLEHRVTAQSRRLPHLREDAQSKVSPPVQDVVERPIWRHEAEVTGLSWGDRLPYRVISDREDGQSVTSGVFSLAPLPPSGTPLKILLTSDHQLKPMVAANLQKLVETVGRVDGVFFAGDLVNVPDRASEWFDDIQGGAFFPALQGRASYPLGRDGTPYRGGAILQHAPLFAAIGNHEVMGRFSSQSSLDDQFNDAIPRSIARQRYDQQSHALNPEGNPQKAQQWIKDQSFNTDTYEAIFTFPESPSGGKRYYATTFGDVRLVVLYLTCIWRSPGLGASSRGKYRERDGDLEQPEQWGYGQHIFEPIVPNSPQYVWLEQELRSPEFQQAKYKIVMFHHPPHTLGENGVPAYTDPVAEIDRDGEGKVRSVRYEYPRSADHLIQHVVPRVEAAGVHLVFYGHSHLWNRFVSPSGLHFLETSNVGNSYGAYVGDRQRHVPEGYREEYAATGDPNGLDPVMPTITPLVDGNGNPQPYIASNEITAFTLLDTGTGKVTSYRFDTRDPGSPVIKFDEFELGG